MPKMKQEKKQKPGVELWVRLLKGGAIALVTAIVILAGVSLLVSMGLLNQSLADKSAVPACVFGALAGGVCALKRSDRGYLPVGASVGAIEWLLLLTVGTICFGRAAGAGEMGVCAAGCLGGGLLAGVLYAMRSGGRRNPKR